MLASVSIQLRRVTPKSCFAARRYSLGTGPGNCSLLLAHVNDADNGFYEVMLVTKDARGYAALSTRFDVSARSTEHRTRATGCSQ